VRASNAPTIRLATTDGLFAEAFGPSAGSAQGAATKLNVETDYQFVKLTSNFKRAGGE
jgi:hypothetical protein